MQVQLIFDEKYKGLHLGCLVADGHLTGISVDTAYSSAISLRILSLLVFLAELNELEMWGTNIFSVY